jgi:quercetin dioxygenase-like cupin family protein
MRRIVPAVFVLSVFVAMPVLAQEQTHAVAGPDVLKWVEPPTLPGAQLAIVQGDPSKAGPFTYRIKMPAGYKIPPHSHKARENVTVLSGVFSVAFGEKFDEGKGQELHAGGFVSVPAQRPHYGWAGGQETIVQVHGVGPTDLRLVK